MFTKIVKFIAPTRVSPGGPGTEKSLDFLAPFVAQECLPILGLAPAWLA
jgi:hypothetical protein